MSKKEANEVKQALAFELWQQGTKYQQIADEVGVSLSAVKSWATRYWKKDKSQNSKKVATKESKKKLQPKKRKRGGQPGNKNATGPPGNQHAVKHGFFCKVLPAETLQIINELENSDQIEILWQNIQIQYAAILRAQKIMFVSDINDKTKELVMDGMEAEAYDVQQAWDKQANFLTAQSRAMNTLASLIKQYDAMVDSGMANQEQVARIQLLRAQIKKLDAEEQTGKSDKVVIVNDLPGANIDE